MKNPAVSVIIPVYNRKKLFLEALESVMNQSFRDFELIVADDCSEDNLKTAVSGGIQLKWLRLKKHTGMAGLVRNRGAEAAAGEYIAFLDSDDLWEKRNLKNSSVLCRNLKVKI